MACIQSRQRRSLNMTEDVEHLVLEHLRMIRRALDGRGERLDRIELRLSGIEQTLGSLCALSGSDRDIISALTRR